MKLLVLFLLITSTSLFAQSNNTIGCGSDYANEQLKSFYPETINEWNYLEEFTKQYRNKLKRGEIQSDTKYIIPVVFHVNHQNGPEKISVAQCQSAIDLMNKDFSADHKEFETIDPAFYDIAANMQIEFRLAKIDPDGNPTTGVTYHENNYNGREPDGSGKTVKLISSWPCKKYLNIWVVREVEDNGQTNNSGWAYYPHTGMADQGLDGIVYNHKYLGTIGTSQYQSLPYMSHVLSHEVGHYLNLKHTHEGGCSEPNDMVNDTPSENVGSGCGIGHKDCGHIHNSENFMGYNRCYKMFTEGQKIRAHAALNSEVGYRNNLWSQENLIATGVIDPDDIEDNSFDISFEISPNPSNGRFLLKSTNEAILEYRVIDIYGNILIKKENVRINQFGELIDMSSFSNSVYFLVLYSEGKREEFSLILNK